MRALHLAIYREVPKEPRDPVDALSPGEALRRAGHEAVEREFITVAGDEIVCDVEGGERVAQVLKFMKFIPLKPEALSIDLLNV